MKVNKILAVIAHPDDLELMAGGSVVKWLKEGSSLHVMCVSDRGYWWDPENVEESLIQADAEANRCSQFIGYTYRNLGYKSLHLNYQDKIVQEILHDIKRYNIDTILCPHEGDLNHDHQIAARLAVAASRRIPRILMGQINYFMRYYFSPNLFVDISESWESKIEACKIYTSQWRQDWYEFMDATSKYYGKIIGVDRAEGFYSPKFML